MKLLIIEDEKELSDSIVSYLGKEDYLCEQAFTFDEAMMKVGVYEYDCILLDLTKSEYELLLFLIENHKRVVSKSAIAEHLSGNMADIFDDFNFIYAHIKNLKAKLSDAGITDCIKTYYGTGYKWNA